VQETDLPFRDWSLNQGIVATLIVPMMLADETVGWIVARCDKNDPYPPEEIMVAQALAQQAALAVYMEQLADQGRRAAVLEERTRMAREIHDTLAQGFAGILLQLEAARQMLGKNVDEARDIITKARDLARQNVTEARRSVWALRPQVLEEAGLPDAFRRALGMITRGTGVEVRFQQHGTPHRLPEELEQDTLRIGIEAATNAVKHASASVIDVELTYDLHALRLSVRDNGAGFDPAAVPDCTFGMTSMRERAGRSGGALKIESAPGSGTNLSLVVCLHPLTEVERPDV
jgi:signal transduction histidine kinase